MRGADATRDCKVGYLLYPHVMNLKPETGRPFPSRGIYFALFALALMALIASLGLLTLTTVLVLFIGVYLLGVVRIWREYRRRTGQPETASFGAVSLGRSLARFSALFILPPGVALLGFVLLYLYAFSVSGI
jgi:hypothetical protein